MQSAFTAITQMHNIRSVKMQKRDRVPREGRESRGKRDQVREVPQDKAHMAVISRTTGKGNPVHRAINSKTTSTADRTLEADINTKNSLEPALKLLSRRIL